MEVKITLRVEVKRADEKPLTTRDISTIRRMLKQYYSDSILTGFSDDPHDEFPKYVVVIVG